MKAGSIVGGIAWDGGYGIRTVEMSTNGGKSWAPAKLGEDLGTLLRSAPGASRSPGRGTQTVTARASNAIGQTQTETLIVNPAGYHHNVMHSVTLNVA